jgi:hypothetical protein
LIEKLLNVEFLDMNSDQLKGDFRMKRAILVILSLAAVCSLCLAGTVGAAKAGYEFTIGTGTPVTFDGAVSPANEWDDSWKDWLYNGWTMGPSFFRDKWANTPAICEQWLMEFLGDTTNDAGDYFEICVDTLVDGGSTPKTDDFKVNWSAAQGVKIWLGTGSGWTAHPTATVGASGDAWAATSIAASPASATPHRIVEIYLDKGVSGGVLAMGLSNNERLAVYDAGTGQTVMWPPFSSANVPDDYGTGTTDLSNTYPEGLTVSLMVALSSVAVVVSIRYFRSRPRIKSYS